MEVRPETHHASLKDEPGRYAQARSETGLGRILALLRLPAYVDNRILRVLDNVALNLYFNA